MNNPIVVSTIAYDGYDLETTLREIGAAGAQNVELAYSEAYTAAVTRESFSAAAAAGVCDVLAANGLKCLCLAAHTDMSQLDSVDKFKLRIDFAKNLGAGYIVSTAGPVANREQFVKNINALGDYAGEVGITICLENMGDGLPNIIDSAAPAVQLIKEINKESVKLNYDFANLLPHLRERLRPEDDYKIALPETGYIHLKDAAKYDNGNWYFPAIGTGIVDFKTILPALAAHPEPIPLSLELSLRINRMPDATTIRAGKAVPLETINSVLAQSLQFVKQYFSEN